MPTEEQVWDMFYKLEPSTKNKFRVYQTNNRDQVQTAFNNLAQDPNTADEDVKQVVEGLLRAGRASQDRSPPSSGLPVQHPSSPRQQTTSDKPTTVALRSFAVHLLQRFPGIIEQDDCEFPVPEDTDTLWFAFDKILGPAITANLTTELGTEAANVQMMHLMLQPLVALFPLAQSGSLITDLDSELGDTATLQGDDSKGYSFLFEKPFKAGTFQGKIEVQVVLRKVPKASGHGNVFAGAFEVKQAGSGALRNWIEQARKEAFAMWMWNARFGFYHKVWVVLTNLEQVIYLEYEGTRESFKHPFKVADVKGELRWAGPYQLLNRSGTSYVATPDSLKALWLLVKGMAADNLPSEHFLQQRLTNATTTAEQALQKCKASVYRKRGREDEGWETSLETGCSDSVALWRFSDVLAATSANATRTDVASDADRREICRDLESAA